MSREILFKAKRADNGKWETGYYFKAGEKHMMLCFFTNENGLYHNMYEIHPKTLCQYTGLNDKNGKKIWENDITEAWSQGTKAIGKIKQRIDGTWIMYPVWQHKTMWYLLPNECGKTTVEVLGNIFDNPDLLEEKHE